MSILRRILVLTIALSACSAGCTPNVFMPTIPATVSGLDLERLREIQEDERLTTDEKREEIRTAVGAENSAEGDRLVDFLLGLNIP